MKIGLPLAAFALALAAPASAAVTISDYDIVFTAGSVVVSSGGKTAVGEYQDNFHFITTEAATFSGSLSTQRLRDALDNLVSDLDFGNSLIPDGVHLDDFYFTVTSGGTDALEVQNLATTFLAAGEHVLTVNYRVQEASAQNAAAYAGPLFLATSPVPEPASWMLMLIGVGTVGMAMRRGPKSRVSFA